MIPDGTLYARFLERGKTLDEVPAVLKPGSPDTTFGELKECIDLGRTALHSNGIGRRSRLGLLINDRAMKAVGHLLAVSTCTSVPLDSMMTPTELSATIKAMRIDGMLMAGEHPEALSDAARQSGVPIITAKPIGSAGILGIATGSSSAITDTSPPEPDDVAVLLYTSGTTSAPKIVPQKQSNRYAAVTRNRGETGIDSSDRCLNLMPLHHTQGLNAEFLTPILNGASVVLAEFNPGSLVKLVERYRPTMFNLVPTMHMSVLTQINDEQGVFVGSSLRYIRSSSAKLVTSLREKLEKAYGIPIVESYGATECSNIANTGVTGTARRPGSVGLPVHPGVTIQDPDGNSLSPGSHGEICVSGPTVISGYEDDPDATAEAFHNGQYRTGDEGYFDDDGFLYVTGRMREVVNRGGEKFSLTEIDEELLRIDGIVEGAAFMQAHENLGHEIFAAVVPTADSKLTGASVRAALASRLSWAKVPKRVLLLKELPKNSTGKVVRDDLVLILEEQSS